MADNHTTAGQRNNRHRVEGPRKHVVAFIFSLLLTLIAFAAVASGEVNTTFIYIILVIMAILQVFIQLSFWMHLKDRGHLYPIIGMIFGVIIVLTLIVMAVYWVWW